MKYCPVFEKDDNRFIIRTEEFLGEDEEEAKQIGWGSMLVECILLKMEYTKEVLKLEEGAELPHYEATLQSNRGARIPVAILSGPLFDEQESQGETQ